MYGSGVYYTFNEDNKSFCINILNGIKLKSFKSNYDKSAIISDSGKIYFINGLSDNNNINKIINSLNIRDICFGKDFNFIIDENGKLYSWGLNSNGQLGLGHIDDINEPQLVEMISKFDVVGISCSETHCACVTSIYLFI